MAVNRGGDVEKMKRELETAKRELAEVNQSKMKFLSLASHQLRAPLAVIKGYVTLLREDGYGEISGKVKEVLGKVEFAVEDMINSITNITDLRKVEEGKMEYEFSETDLVGLAKDVVEGFKPLALSKKLDVTFEASARDIFVNADARELKHVVQNLIDNAIKYTPTGFIKVSVKDAGDKVVLSVTDSGIGIAEGVKPLLFEEFVRDERVKAEIRGSGIGLHIAKSIIDAHGGKIWCESAGEGRGSIFSFSLAKIK